MRMVIFSIWHFYPKCTMEIIASEMNGIVFPASSWGQVWRFIYRLASQVMARTPKPGNRWAAQK